VRERERGGERERERERDGGRGRERERGGERWGERERKRVRDRERKLNNDTCRGRILIKLRMLHYIPHILCEQFKDSAPAPTVAIEIPFRKNSAK
jgi:hypothetical protein